MCLRPSSLRARRLIGLACVLATMLLDDDELDECAAFDELPLPLKKMAYSGARGVTTDVSESVSFSCAPR
jgi:hypothetical protein